MTVGKVQIYDTSDNPVQGVQLNIFVGEKIEHLFTDYVGKAYFQLSFGFNDLGTRRIKISSPYMLVGEKEKEVLVVFPWTAFTIALSLIALMITLIYAIRCRGRLKTIKHAHVFLRRIDS